MGYGSILNQSFETSPVLDNYFTKDETLTSNTASLYGLSSSAVPDDVLAKARSLITTAQNTANNANTNANGRLSVVTGSYTGASSASPSVTKTISVSGKPYVLMFRKLGSDVGSPFSLIARADQEGIVSIFDVTSGAINSTSQATIRSIGYSFSETSISLTGSSSAIDQSGSTYQYIALCTG